MAEKGRRKKAVGDLSVIPLQSVEQLNGTSTVYKELLGELKSRIRSAQIRAVFAVNRELILLYWEVGRLISVRQESEGWGASVIPGLVRDLHNEMTDVKGFSERNVGRMVAFYREYPMMGGAFLPQAVAKIEEADAHQEICSMVLQLPWGHNILLIEKIKQLSLRQWYIVEAIEHGWSRNVLRIMIEGNVHARQGKSVTNFMAQLPPPQSDLARDTLKDPYIFDFITLDGPLREREIEAELIRHLEKFLLELGKGFAFVGRQHHLDIGDQDFYIDLLFYHLTLRCFIVIDLKTGPFKPEYAGKINFYLSVVDDRLRHKSDNPSIGLILCQDKKKVIAEYALQDMNKPIGVSEYELSRALPSNIKSQLPTIEEIEAELGGNE